MAWPILAKFSRSSHLGNKYVPDDKYDEWIWIQDTAQPAILIY